MAWDESTGIESIDQQLLRSVPPHILKMLGIGTDGQPAPSSQPAGVPSGTMVNPTKPVSFIASGGAQNDFRGNPPGASPQGSGAAPISLANPSERIHDSDHNPASLRSRDLKNGGVQNAIAEGRTPPTSDPGKALEAAGVFDLKEGNPDQGVSPTSVPQTTNAGRMLRAATQPNAETGGTRPTSAIQGSIDAGQVTEGTAAAASAQPISFAGPAERRFEDLEKKGAPQLHGWKKWLDIAGQALSPRTEAMIPGTPGNFNVRLMQAAANATKEQAIGKERQAAETTAAQAQFNTPEKRRAFVKANPDLLEGADQFQINDWVATGNKFPQREPAPEKATDKKIDEYTNDQGRRVLTFQRANGETYDRVGGQTQPKSSGHTSAFEAFAYGSPEEKKAAQDYLEFEKRMGAKYHNPNEFEERYKLFKEDPDTYRSLFGDKSGAGPDRATATKMLNYFDRRRREVNQDFTLDDSQKQEQLKDIESLEKPFLEAVQPGSRGGNEDRVTVVHPNGKVGTIPRSQLDKAKKKGYRVQQ